MSIVKKILEVRKDGRFVVIFGKEEIVTLNCTVPNNLSSFKTPEELFLAGVAHARLCNRGDITKSRIMTKKSEEL